MDRITLILSTYFLVILFLIFRPPTAGITSDDRPDRRHVPLEGQSNFRDLGGYKTSDGRTVVWGQVYRTGELPRLTDADVATLKELNLQTVHNFLLEEEIAERGEDRLPEDTNLVKNPIRTNEDELVVALLDARKTGDFSIVPPDLNKEVHRILAREGREEYAVMLRSIMNPENRPFAFHCSHGIHRTGTAAAILLSALGVPWDTIREDYLLSNTYRAEEIERRIEELTLEASKTLGVPKDEVDTTNLVAFYVLEGEYIDGTLEVIEKEYGSMKNYLISGLGLTEDEIRTLKEQLLE